MHDNDLTELFARARTASARLDTARAELAFATRMAAVISRRAQLPGPAATFQTWLRAVIGLAAAAGIMLFFFITGRGDLESADTLHAFWTDSAAAWDLQLFD
jgi:hypothetical protein